MDALTLLIFFSILSYVLIISFPGIDISVILFAIANPNQPFEQEYDILTQIFKEVVEMFVSEYTEQEFSEMTKTEVPTL